MFRATLPASTEARRILVGTLFSAVGRGLTLPFLFDAQLKSSRLEPDAVILLKGSRGMRLERLVNPITDWANSRLTP